MTLTWLLLDRRTGEHLGCFKYERGAQRTLESLKQHCPQGKFEIVTQLEKRS